MSKSFGPKSRAVDILKIAVALVTVAAGLTAVLQYPFRPRNQVIVEALVSSPLISESSHVAAQAISIEIAGQIVTNPHLLVLQISNSGTAPIQPSDIERPFGFRFADANPVSFGIIKASPENINASIGAREGAVIVETGLLNPGNTLDIYFILDSQPSSILAEFRSASIDGPKLLSEPYGREDIAPWWFLVIMLIIVPIGTIFIMYKAVSLAARPALEGIVGLSRQTAQLNEANQLVSESLKRVNESLKRTVETASSMATDARRIADDQDHGSRAN